MKNKHTGKKSSGTKAAIIAVLFLTVTLIAILAACMADVSAGEKEPVVPPEETQQNEVPSEDEKEQPSKDEEKSSEDEKEQPSEDEEKPVDKETAEKPESSLDHQNNSQPIPPSQSVIETVTKDKDTLAKEFAEEKQEWYLLLANPDHALPAGFAPETEIVQNSYKMDVRVAPAAREMIAAAKSDGVDLLVCSAYRSIEKQTTLFNNMKQDYLAAGMSEQEAYAKTANAIAVPGTSEHHTGLAADIVTPAHQTLDPQFADTAAGQWLVDHAHEYGFILRYPADKQDITKIMYESWHFRFVGKTHAKLMRENNLCLEEYLALETPPPGYKGKVDPFAQP